jgi:hypothetical protein
MFYMADLGRAYSDRAGNVADMVSLKKWGMETVFYSMFPAAMRGRITVR